MKKFITIMMIIVICLASCFGMTGCATIETQVQEMKTGKVVYKDDDVMVVKYGDGTVTVHGHEKSAKIR